LGSKIKDSSTFKLDLNWGYTKINLNKLFEDFSNLELLEIDLNNSNLNQYFKWKTFKMINKIRFGNLKRNLNLFEKKNRPRAQK
jgi:hypothetical protein